MSSELKKNFAIKTAKEAGQILMKYFRTNKIQKQLKKGNQWVTRADKESEKLILKRIKESGFNGKILSEERGELSFGKSRSRWIVDPLDGTIEYTKGSSYFCVSMALEENGEIVLGVVYSPALNELFYAEKNKGAFLNGKRIHVSQETNLKKSIIDFAVWPTKNVTKEYLVKLFSKQLIMYTYRFHGALALEACHVARGTFEVVLDTSANLYDIAAALLIIQEAGGNVTNIHGKQWNLGWKKNSFLASNGKIHKKVLRLFKL